MKITGAKKSDNTGNLLREKLVIIEALVFFIPVLTIAYIYFQKKITFDITQIIIFISALLIVLGGLMILRQIFDRILMVQTLLKKTEQGERLTLDTKKDTGELNEITKSFHRLVNNFENVNSELERRIEEIAQRKQMEAALKRAKEEAEATNVAKSRFLSNMSHELCTPLNAIIGFSKVLAAQKHGELNDKQRRYVNNILNSGENLFQLVNNILELTKIESEKVELTLSSFKVEDELYRTVMRFQKSAGKKKIKISSDIQQGLPPINADRDKIQQIVSNLLDNAVKFTPENGAVVVAAYVKPLNENVHAPLPLSEKKALEDKENVLEISVSDNGIGIKHEDQARIFSIFEQVDASQQRKFGGTGFGLAMSRKLVELHQGKIGVESGGEGKGSRFSFTLPLS